MNEQIKEMMKTICKNYGDCSKCSLKNIDQDDTCSIYQDCEALYNENYRKVIHCKDCAYRDTEGCPNTYWNGGELESNVEDDSFCSEAKMKGGAQE